MFRQLKQTQIHKEDTLKEKCKEDKPPVEVPWSMIHSYGEKQPEYKEEITAQVKQKILKEAPKLDSTLSADVCDECGVQMTVIANDSMLACKRCAKTRVITSANAWNSSMDADFTTLHAHQKSRILEWLEMVQAKEYGDIEDDFLRAIAMYLFETKQSGFEDPAIVKIIEQDQASKGPYEDVVSAKKRLEPLIRKIGPVYADFDFDKKLLAMDHICVRNVLKSIDQADARKFSERAAKISSLLTGFLPERLSAHQEEYIRKLFMTATPIQNRFRKSSQPNWPGGYPYFLRCLLVLLGWDEIAAHFPTSIANRSAEREEQRREMWALLRWEFCPSSGNLSAIELPDGTILNGLNLAEADRRSK